MSLTNEQIQEMRDLRLNQKKQPKEIIELFKAKGIQLKGWEVTYHCRTLTAKPSGGGQGKERIQNKGAGIRRSRQDKNLS